MNTIFQNKEKKDQMENPTFFTDRNPDRFNNEHCFF
jgi:hypothetical protein